MGRLCPEPPTPLCQWLNGFRVCARQQLLPWVATPTNVPAVDEGRESMWKSTHKHQTMLLTDLHNKQTDIDMKPQNIRWETEYGYPPGINAFTFLPQSFPSRSIGPLFITAVINPALFKLCLPSQPAFRFLLLCVFTDTLTVKALTRLSPLLSPT